MKKSKRFKISPEFAAYRKKTYAFVGDSDPLALLRTGVTKVERAILKLKPAHHGKRPGRGKWSAHEILSHLVDVEFIFGWRIRRGLAEPGKPIEAMDQEAWAAALPYRKLSVTAQLAALKAMRAANVAMLGVVSPKAHKAGWVMHPERGKETTATQLRMWAGHDLNHLSQLHAIHRRFNADTRRRAESGARGNPRSRGRDRKSR